MGDRQETNREVIRRWIAPAPGGGPTMLTAAAKELMAEDVVWYLPPTAVIPGAAEPRVIRGRDAIVAIQQRAHEIYQVATIRTEIRNLLADGDWVVLQYEMRCTAANGNDYLQEYVFMFELRDGRIVTIWDYYDTLQVERVVLTPAP